MTRCLRLLPLLLTCLCSLSLAQQWSGVLDPSRAVNWSSAGSAHIDDTRAQCGSTIAAYNGSAATINTAITNCSANGYVLLGPGTFNLSSAITFTKSNVTLRGSGSNSTFLVFSGASSCGGYNAAICVYSGDGNYWQSPNNTASWNGTNGVSGTYTKGATSIILSAVNSLNVGDPIILDQTDDQSDNGALYVGCEYSDGSSSCYNGTWPSGPQRNGGSLSTIRGQQQMVNVTSISGSGPYSVGITPSLYAANWQTSHNPQAWWASTPLFNDAVENLSANFSPTSVTAIMFWGCSGCWVKGIRALETTSRSGTANFLVAHLMSNHITVRDSYFYGITADTYALGTWISSDDLWENNIFQNVPAPMVCNSDCEGMVRGYNFSVNDHYANSANWLNQSSQVHSTTLFVLDESNVGAGDYMDSFHGTHNLHTQFRNRWDGNEPNNGGQASSGTVPLRLNPGTRYNNAIGNVLGSPGYHTNYKATPSGGNLYASAVGAGVYPEVGTTDALSNKTSMFWGNYDTGTGAVRWCGNSGDSGWSTTCSSTSEVPTGLSDYSNAIPASETLPASFYHSSKPSFWGSEPWPAIGPDITGGNVGQCSSSAGTSTHFSQCTADSQCGAGTCSLKTGKANSNPAMDCYLNIMGGPTNGVSGSPLAFDAAACYGGSQQGGPLPPNSLVGTVH
jgi:hypothetical protein